MFRFGGDGTQIVGRRRRGEFGGLAASFDRKSVKL
jgi:hypothetical protein